MTAVAALLGMPGAHVAEVPVAFMTVSLLDPEPPVIRTPAHHSRDFVDLSTLATHTGPPSHSARYGVGSRGPGKTTSHGASVARCSLVGVRHPRDQPPCR